VLPVPFLLIGVCPLSPSPTPIERSGDGDTYRDTVTLSQNVNWATVGDRGTLEVYPLCNTSYGDDFGNFARPNPRLMRRHRPGPSDCINFFRKIDPEFESIRTFAGIEDDTTYRRHDDGKWRASLKGSRGEACEIPEEEPRPNVI
jgi:hypothetical protein